MSQNVSLEDDELTNVEDARCLGPSDVTERACVAAAESGHTFVTVNTDGAMAAAEAADRRRSRGEARSLLDGVPVAVKDVIDTQGLRTTMASRHFASHVPSADAAVVRDLRQAGAVIVGKTNCNEFSYGILGDVAADGVVTNPHDASRLAGGSSSGSAAAVALGVVPVAVGTDTAGSVRVPAALCGVVGFKPTLGVVDTQGVFPLSPSFDTVGYFGTCVRDVKAVLTSTGVLSGGSVEESAVEDLTVVGLKAFRAAVADPVVGVPYDIVMRRLGAREVDAPAPYSREPSWGELYGTIRSREAYLVHQGLVAGGPGLYQPATLAQVLAGESVSDTAVSAAQVEVEDLRERFLEACADVDVLVCPTVPIQAPRAKGVERHVGAELMSLSLPWNVLGWPALTVPHWVEGCHLPQSVQIVGKPGCDAEVLRAGALVERLLAQGRPGGAVESRTTSSTGICLDSTGWPSASRSS